jgi:hypothetical protein
MDSSVSPIDELVSAPVPSHFKSSLLQLNAAAAAHSANASPSHRSSASCRFYSGSESFSPFTVSEKRTFDEQNINSTNKSRKATTLGTKH